MFNPNGNHHKETAEWLVMVYIAANDTLANFAIESLKQLKSASSKKVIVAAQLDVDGLAQTRKVKRFIFNGTGGRHESIELNRVESLDASTNMTQPDTLAGFVKWAYEDPRCNAYRHCLYLWGDGGFEVLVESDSNAQGNSSKKTPYLTPLDLGKALDRAGLGSKHKKLEILGIDACCMSLIEVACELENYVDFMCASEEEVPDQSFPYKRFLKLFRKNGRDSASICRRSCSEYKFAYQDYVCTERTTVKEVTLSALGLDQLHTITQPLKEMVQALTEGMGDAEMGKAVHLARTKAKGFMGGLVTDICDFSDKLAAALKPANDYADLRSACHDLCAAIKRRNSAACVITNEVMDPSHSHGLCFYFPYLSGNETFGLSGPLMKGSPNMLIKGSPDQLNKLRLTRIKETEAYYNDLAFSKETGWGKFIQQQWSRILAELEPALLDVRYSAEQCALNLLAVIQQEELKKTNAPGRPAVLANTA